MGHRTSNIPSGRFIRELLASKSVQFLLAELPDLIFFMDLDGTFLFISDSIHRFGAAPEEICGTSLLDYIKPEEKPEIIAKLKERADGYTDSRSLRINMQIKGKTVSLEVRSRLVNLPDDYKFPILFGAARDISENLEMEKKLNLSTKRYEAVFQSANDAIFLLQGGKIVDCNEKTMELFEATAEEIFKQGPEQFSPQFQPCGRSSMALSNKYISQCIKGEPLRFEWVHRKKRSDTLFYTEVSLNRVDIKDFDVLAIVRDISAFKSTQENLRKSTERFKALVEHSPDIIMRVNPEMRLIYINSAINRHFSFDIEKCLHKNICQIGFPEGFKQFFKAKIPQVFSSGKPDSGNITVDGYSFDWRIQPELNSSGEPENILCDLRDTTEKKKLEFSLNQAQKMEALGTLSRGIAHDFNNILGGIMGYSELLLPDCKQGSSAERYITGIQEAADRAIQLVKQILTYSRPSREENTPVELKPVLTEAISFLRASFPSSIEINPNLSEDIRVMGDSSKLHQIIMNLCTNSMHAMEETGGTLSINLSKIDHTFSRFQDYISKGEYALLEIKDTGHGIPEEITDKIFDPYFTTKSDQKGTGLGLSTVYGLIKSYNGKIHVESQPGNTVFRIFLPTTNLKSEAPVPNEKSSHSKKLANGRILLIDDEVQLLEVTKIALESLGYSVDAYSESLEAWEAFRSRPEHYHLVLTDYTMPKLMGDELLRKVQEYSKETIVILMTGLGDSIEEKIKNFSDFQILKKPYTIDCLCNTIESVIQKNSSS